MHQQVDIKKILRISIAWLLGILFFPFVIGYFLSKLAYKYIPNTKLKYTAIALIALLSLTIGSAWASGLVDVFGDASSSSRTNDSTQVQPITHTLVATPDEQQQTEGVLVTRVIDGDTIELEDGQRVRYIGVNTPETVDPRVGVQCFGKEASAKNKELVLNQRVRLEKDVSETDRYDRLLRYVYVGDTFINDRLVREGYAHASSYPPDVKFQEQFRQAEQEARANNRGLWGSCPAETTAPVGTAAPITAPTTSSGSSSSGSTTQADTQLVGECNIKGNISAEDEKIYHVPGCKSYTVTKIDPARGEKMFCSEAEAKAAGWRKALNCS